MLVLCLSHYNSSSAARPKRFNEDQVNYPRRSLHGPEGAVWWYTRQLSLELEGLRIYPRHNQNKEATMRGEQYKGTPGNSPQVYAMCHNDSDSPGGDNANPSISRKNGLHVTGRMQLTDFPRLDSNELWALYQGQLGWFQGQDLEVPTASGVPAWFVRVVAR